MTTNNTQSQNDNPTDDLRSFERSCRIIENICKDIKEKMPCDSEYFSWTESSDSVAGGWVKTRSVYLQKYVESGFGNFELKCGTFYNENHRDDISEDDIRVPIHVTLKMVDLDRYGMAEGERVLFKAVGFYKWAVFYDTCLKIFAHLESIIERGIKIAGDGEDWFALIVARAVIRESGNVPQLGDGSDLQLLDSDHMEGENHDYDEVGGK